MCEHTTPFWWQSVIIGASGGTAVWLLGIMREWFQKWKDKRKIYIWLMRNTSTGDFNHEWRSALVIGGNTDLPIDRVRYICSIHEKIRPSSTNGQFNGFSVDLWGLKEIVDKPKNSN